jgi:hypothetical protein
MSRVLGDEGRNGTRNITSEPATNLGELCQTSTALFRGLLVVVVDGELRMMMWTMLRRRREPRI